MKRIAMLALFGAVGFGIGGLFLGPAALFAFAIGFQQTMIWPSGIIALAVLCSGFAAKGALGGTALGLALSKGRRMTTTLALFSAIGFLVGGLLFLFLVPGGMMFREVPPSTETGTAIWPLAVFVFAVLGLGFVVNEALVETKHDLALRKGRKITAALALFGAIVFLVGGFVFAFLQPWWMFPAVSSGIICLEGALGGAALGLALRDKKIIIGLALAGALGFWIGLVIANYVQHWLQSGGLLLPVIKFSLQGLIGGAVLGAILGYLERQKATQDT